MVGGRFDEPVEEDNSFPNIRTLIDVVGGPLQYLSVVWSVKRSEPLLDVVWAACPNLTVLKIEPARFQSLDYFVDAYETDKCRVQSLCLGDCTVEDRSSLTRFFQALEGSRGRTKMASTLKEFSCSKSRDDDSVLLSAGELMNIADWLRNNQRLQYVALSVRAQEFDRVAPKFKGLQNEYLLGQGVPLPMRCKCALLSVVDHASTQENSEPIPAASQVAQLDGGVLSCIMALAGKPVKRSIALKPW